MLTLGCSSLMCQIYRENRLKPFWETVQAKLLCFHLVEYTASFREEVVMQRTWQLFTCGSWLNWWLNTNIPGLLICLMVVHDNIHIIRTSVFTCNGPQTHSFPSERTCKSWLQDCCWSDHANIDSCPPLCKAHARSIWEYKKAIHLKCYNLNDKLNMSELQIRMSKL